MDYKLDQQPDIFKTVIPHLSLPLLVLNITVCVCATHPVYFIVYTYTVPCYSVNSCYNMLYWIQLVNTDYSDEHCILYCTSLDLFRKIFWYNVSFLFYNIMPGLNPDTISNIRRKTIWLKCKTASVEMVIRWWILKWSELSLL